jgi:hypothetical protein
VRLQKRNPDSDDPASLLVGVVVGCQ